MSSQYDELERLEQKIFDVINKNISKEKDIVGMTDFERYKLVKDNNKMQISGMCKRSHPIIMDKLYLLFVASVENNVPKEIYYVIVSKYLDDLNNVSNNIALDIEEEFREKLKKYKSSRGMQGPRGEQGPIGIPGPQGNPGPRGIVMTDYYNPTSEPTIIETIYDYFSSFFW